MTDSIELARKRGRLFVSILFIILLLVALSLTMIDIYLHPHPKFPKKVWFRWSFLSPLSVDYQN